MSLEEEIKQTKEISAYEKGIVNILLTYYMVENKLSLILSEHNLTMQQYNILRILRGVYPGCYSNNEIRERMLHKSADATRLVDRLAEKDFVQRSQCKEDRRRVDISISSKGLKILADIDTIMPKIESIINNLDKKEVDQLNTLLEKMRESNA